MPSTLSPLLRTLRSAPSSSSSSSSSSSHRLLHTSTRLRASPPWSIGPAPPRLPKEEQEIFEKLQSTSTGAFSTPTTKPSIIVNQSPASSSSSSPSSTSPSRPQINQSPHTTTPPSSSLSSSPTPSDRDLASINARVEATGDGEELHPDVRRGAFPEFEGDRNPKTGEVGGPKNEPLRWGGDVDWSYNGRVTDF
ncbi:MAG: putative mitochondrial protein, conserved [Pycnora praestabilis]|nr:MAG: putative mitochondrial protein, conserved [Pycnora praestabilis]